MDSLTRDKYSKEGLILNKTYEEMELRIETQKQTLAARDESIKKLLEMLQSKGEHVGHSWADVVAHGFQIRLRSHWTRKLICTQIWVQTL